MSNSRHIMWQKAAGLKSPPPSLDGRCEPDGFQTALAQYAV